MASAAPAAAPLQPAPATSPSAAQARQSLYQRLSNSPEAEAGRAKAPARAAAATYVQDIPSADDETIEESGVFGRAAVERILGGKLIEERSPDGSPDRSRFLGRVPRRGPNRAATPIIIQAKPKEENVYEGAVQELIDELGRLPGVGPKSAQRLAFHILEADPQDMKRLVEAITTVKERVKFCTVCGNVTEQELCNICRDPRRDPSVICVVEESKDVLAVERTRSFRGRYHVLGGAINPIAGVGPEQLRIRELLTRLNDGAIQEVIIATDPNLEGEATATYLARMLKTIGIAVTRLASGLPVGGDLEYADEVTLGRAFEGRRNALT